MKEKFKQIPQPLRKQILLRCAGTGLALAMLLFVLVYSRDWRFFIPCVVAAVLCGYCEKDTNVTVKLRGGDLTVNYHSNGDVELMGSVKKVYEGTLEI